MWMRLGLNLLVWMKLILKFVAFCVLSFRFFLCSSPRRLVSADALAFDCVDRGAAPIDRDQSVRNL